MNAVEIEEAVEALVARPFDRSEFPFEFLTAFGNKDTTVRRLRSGSSNNSDVAYGVLQRSNIHIATCAAGAVEETLAALRSSLRTEAQKAKFILATDGDVLQAEDLLSGEPLACDYPTLHEHFGFFLPLAGISTVSEIKNNPIDIKATGRLNKLYVELLKDNPDWGTPEKRPALNQFMARLIFCFFAEDTGIFRDGMFTATIAQMSHAGHGSGDERWGNTHEVLVELFRAMDTDTRQDGRLDGRHRKAAGIKSWADVFPYVNGGLFAGNVEWPKFSRIARSYLLRAGELNWREINPDIFGSMIQAVADDDERGELGMHYTSVPNILKVLNPLFLTDLREQLEEAGENVRKLRNLRKRIANVRVFDPACGSGNFLVIAYLKMREIEHAIVQRSGDEPRSVIRLSNFFGIEIKSFAVEIARLSLLIAEFQADCRYLSQHEARAMVLPLHRTGQIHVGNALCTDWFKICPPLQHPEFQEYDLAGPTGRLALETSPEGRLETFVCSNPPYKGSQSLSARQKTELEEVCSNQVESVRQLDYVAGWFFKASEFLGPSDRAAFVSTNSICQGRIVPIMWPALLVSGVEICFAYTSFKWSNLASHNAGVTVSIIGLTKSGNSTKRIYQTEPSGDIVCVEAENISPYLLRAPNIIVEARSKSISNLPKMDFGNMPADGGGLIVTPDDIASSGVSKDSQRTYFKELFGSNEVITGSPRWCIWFDDNLLEEAMAIPLIRTRIDEVRRFRLQSKDSGTKSLAERPHQFRERKTGQTSTIVIPIHTSESREYLPVALLGSNVSLTNAAFGLYDAPLHYLALIASRLHLVWIGTVCGKLETRYRYSNTLGWNTFPVPPLTDQNRAELTDRAVEMLTVREAHFPATIADLYVPENMPADLRRAHDANDEALERIYIGRRFRNDTERLEKLFELYTKMASNQPNAKRGTRAA